MDYVQPEPIKAEIVPKECAWCNKEVGLALFGVALGLMFIIMSLDTLRRMRLSNVDVEVVQSD